MKTAIGAALLILCSCPSAFAQAQQAKPRTELVFSCSCSDQAGTLFAAAFRDLLATSPRYIEASQAELKGPDGKQTIYNWQLKVVSVDDTSNGQATAISSVLLLGSSFYMDQYVQVCGRDKAAFCAQQLLALVDSDLNSK